MVFSNDKRTGTVNSTNSFREGIQIMSQTLVKEKDVVVYSNPGSYSHNAVVELVDDDEMLCVVQEQKRRKYRTHSDPTSTCILLRSKDGGNTWDPKTKTLVVESENEAINDPAIKRLRDGTLIVTYFKWMSGGDDEVPTGKESPNPDILRTLDGEHYTWRTGSYTIRSTDNGKSWEEPVYVPSPTGKETGVSDPVIQLPNDDLLIPLYGAFPGEQHRVTIMRSKDGGKSWGDAVTAAFDPFGQMSFEEPALLYLPSGKIICMIRIHRVTEQEYGYYLYQTDSYDLGKTWSTPVKTPIWGHPPHMVHLDSGKILLVYGYRRAPFGIRACLSHDEGQTWDIENELILRADGIDRDLGYPTSVQFSDGRIFTVWYMTKKDEQGLSDVADMGTLGNQLEFFHHPSPLAYIGGSFYREI